MSSQFFPATLEASPPPRGPGDQQTVTLTPQSCTMEFSWGPNPSTCTLVYVGETVLNRGADVRIVTGPHAFHGICMAEAQRLSARGHSFEVKLVDFRKYLADDQVFGAFNQVEIVNEGGVRKRLFRHILPANYQTWIRTYTTVPYSAAAILDFLFSAPTVQTQWIRQYHAAQALPVYDLDFLSGRSLAAALQEVSAKQGLDFGLKGGSFRLEWVRRGDALFPGFPIDADDRRVGLAVSGHPTRVHVVGDRNVYQIKDIPMSPDWAPGWQTFWDVDLLADYLYQFATDPRTGLRYNDTSATGIGGPDGDPEEIVGRQLSAARAREILVWEVAELVESVTPGDGVNFQDARKFAGRQRMDMPAALYIEVIVWRAFRIQSGLTTFQNVYGQVIPLESLTLVDRLLVAVSHDPLTGDMSFLPDEPIDGNGYAIVQGYQVGQDAFRTLQPTQFRPDQWLNQQDIWQALSFQVDDSGFSKFILFDQPVFRSEDAVTLVDGLAVLRANPTLTVPPVRACLVFEAERFIFTGGTGNIDGTENVNGLHGEYLGAADGSIPLTQVPYADGELVNFKAAQIATALLNRPYAYVEGGYRKPTLTGTQLSAMVNRVQVNWSPGGAFEAVDWTNERDTGAFTPPPDLARRVQEQFLLPGQAELREEARLFRLLAAGVKAGPSFARTLANALHGVIGSGAALSPVTVESPSGQLSAGTPLWKRPPNTGTTPTSQTRVVMPPAVESPHEVFAGAVVRDGETAASPLKVQARGVLPIRVKGPVSVGDAVGRAQGQAYLSAPGDVAVGIARQAITTSDVRLILVEIGSGTGGESGPAEVVKMFRYKSQAMDHIVAVEWDGENDGAETLIAKPYKLRGSIQSQVIDGITFGYSYENDFMERIAEPAGERQRIVPRWLVNDVIYAQKVEDGAGVTIEVEVPGEEEPEEIELEYLDLNVDARAWARAINQAPL